MEREREVRPASGGEHRIGGEKGGYWLFSLSGAKGSQFVLSLPKRGLSPGPLSSPGRGGGPLAEKTQGSFPLLGGGGKKSAV